MGDDLQRQETRQIAAWFLGPKAENSALVEEMMRHILQDYMHWRRNYFPSDEILIPPSMRREAVEWTDRLTQQVTEMLAGLRRHFPFYNPRYIAHMLSDQTIPSVLGYFAGMLYNPNNVTPEAAPVTVAWEFEVARSILQMLGYRPPPAGETKEEFGWAHVTNGGTVANLEALWAARNIRYFPLAVQDACRRHGIPLTVKLPYEGDRPHPIAELPALACLGIRPNQAIYLYSRFANAVRHHWNLDRNQAADRVLELLAESKFSIANFGTEACYQTARPVILVPGTVHYSIYKIADVLGIGRKNILLVDVDKQFRLDVNGLDKALHQALAGGMLPVAVIGIVSTTEEGAVDPLHRIVAVREGLEASAGHSFWLHVDAAWGGYFRSMFETGAESSGLASDQERIAEVNEFAKRTISIVHGRYNKKIVLEWGHGDVCESFLAMPKAESVTVDPHKMGYIPYPCGVVAFRNDLVRQFLSEDAPYLAETSPAMQSDHHHAPASLGPYIFEGSKPGAAVAACWLSHRMIPPTRGGHGEIVRASLLAARELHERLVHWETACIVNGETVPYRLLTITSYPPDTNIVCFVVQEKINASLERMNRINEWIYRRFTINTEAGREEYSYAQPFFLSRTVFRTPQYALTSMADLLLRAGLEPDSYTQHGIFVLRATVMTPYVVLASESGHKQELLAEFMVRLSQTANEALHAVE
jgi:glutamate/tyrosine decarboxylase-like PLP-dependent enzyme